MDPSSSEDHAPPVPAAPSDEMDVNVMEKFGNFVLNVKVLGSESGAGVPTLPVRIPQIVEDGRLSFDKLIEIVIMIASSQQQTPSYSTDTLGPNQRVQYQVILSFPNPQTQNSVMISTAEELLELMDRYSQDQPQLTLIAKVQHDIVERESSSSVTTPPRTDSTLNMPRSPVRRPTLEVEEEDDDDQRMPRLSIMSVGMSSVMTLDSSRTGMAMDLYNNSVTKSSKLDFDPPVFTQADDPHNKTLVSLMEQLLEIQSNRMQQFATHMEDRMASLINQRIVTSEDRLKQCLRDTVQLVEDDPTRKDGYGDEDDSDDEGYPNKTSNTSTSNNNLEKIVKDQMVSMELRFAKLEQQSKETAAIARSPSGSQHSRTKTSSPPTATTTTTPPSVQQHLQTMDSRLETMEQVLLGLRQDTETTKHAILQSASPARASQPPQPQQPSRSPHAKPPLPPKAASPNTSGAIMEPALLLPRLTETAPAPPSSSVLNVPLPPSPHITTSNAPVSPPTTDRLSFPSLAPVSPPQQRSADGTSLTFDNDDLKPSDTLSTNPSMEEEQQQQQQQQQILVSSPNVTSTNNDTDWNQTPPNANTSASVSTTSGTRSSKHKKSVREMLAAQSKKAAASTDISKEELIVAGAATSFPVDFPFLDASKSVLAWDTPPTATKGSVQEPTTTAELPLTSPQSSIQSHDATPNELKMKQAIKDHMQSMESRVSKLRELNKQQQAPHSQQQTTPTTAATSTVVTPSLTSPTGGTARTLFPDQQQQHVTMDTAALEKVLETQLTDRLDDLRQTMQKDTSSETDKLMDFVEDMLEKKMVLFQKTTPGSEDGPPMVPQRRTSQPDTQMLESLIERRLDALENMVKRTTKKLEDQEEQWKEQVVSPLQVLLSTTSPKLISVSKTNADGTSTAAAATIPSSVVLAQINSILNQRMDTMESLVQLTATELEAATKQIHKRLNAKLLDQILDGVEDMLPPLPPTSKGPPPPIHDHVPSGDLSVDTSSYPTVYGDEDEEEEPPPARSNQGGHRSLEQDLVAMDREASVREIYGDIEIDDAGLPEDQAAMSPRHKARGNFAEVVGRGKSLRDICHIDTIDEEEGELEDSSHHLTSRDSNHSDVTARSLSVRNIYGEHGTEIDDRAGQGGAATAKSNDDNSAANTAPPAFKNESQDAPPAPARRTISAKDGGGGGGGQLGNFLQGDNDADNEGHDEGNEVPVGGRDWTQSFSSMPSLAPMKGDVPPAPASRSISGSSHSKDTAPSLAQRAVSTREIYGDADIDDAKNDGDDSQAEISIDEDDDQADIDDAKNDGDDSQAEVSIDENDGQADIDESAVDKDDDKNDGDDSQAEVSIDESGVEDDIDKSGVDKDDAENDGDDSQAEVSIDEGDGQTDIDESAVEVDIDGSGVEVDSDEDDVEDNIDKSDGQAEVSIDESGVEVDIDEDDVDIDTDDETDPPAEKRISQPQALPDFSGYDNIDIDIKGDPVKEENSSGSVGSGDVYDNLSLDGVDETRAFVDASGASITHDTLISDDEDVEEVEQASVSIDGDSVAVSMFSTDNDSDSSYEDEEYFHDHERRQLTVLSTAMSRVRAARKGTGRYESFQNSIFTARRDGPLALKVKERARQNQYSDDESYYSESESASGHHDESGSCMVTDSERFGSNADSIERSERIQYDRSKQRAFLIAKSMAKRRAANRAILFYRRLLFRKFTPRSRRGPLALTEKSESSYRTGTSGASERSSARTGTSGGGSSPAPSDSSASNAYAEEGNASSEIMEGSGSIPVERFAADGYRETAPSPGESDSDDDASADANQALRGDSAGDVDTGEDPISNEDDGPYCDSGDIDLGEDPVSHEVDGPYRDSGDIDLGEDPVSNVTDREALFGDSAGDIDMGEDPVSNATDREALFGDSAGDIDMGEDPVSNATDREALFGDSAGDIDMGEDPELGAKPTEPTAEEDSDSSSVEEQNSSSPTFRRIPTPESLPDETPADEDDAASNNQGRSVDSTSRDVYKRSIEDDESLNLGDTTPASPRTNKSKPVGDAEKQTEVATLAKPPEAGGRSAVTSPRRPPGNGSPPRSSPHEAVEEEGAFKPEDLKKHQPTTRQQQSIGRSNDAGGGAWEEKTAALTDMEMKEWAAAGSPVTAPMRPAVRSHMDAGESKEESELVDQVLIMDHINDIKAQIQQWQEIFLASNQGVQQSHFTLQTSNDTLTASNEKLQSSVQESIEDSHHFAAYLDKMLTERIGQLEEAIRTQTAVTSQAFVAQRDEQAMVQLSTSSSSPPRARSAPTSPMHQNSRSSAPSQFRTMNPFDGPLEEEEKDDAMMMTSEEKNEMISSMVVTVNEWKRLQDKLRGTEEVAESYRKQVLQLRTVLEVKINEGNASQHQVDVLQRKLQEAHDREVQAQKQLRPVTRRVEQVIQEMVQLEEHSASLQVENGRLREQLWMVQREF